MQNQKQCAILVSILSDLTAQLDDDKRSLILKQVIKRLKELPRVGYIEIWMTYLLLMATGKRCLRAIFRSLYVASLKRKGINFGILLGLMIGGRRTFL